MKKNKKKIKYMKILLIVAFIFAFAFSQTVNIYNGGGSCGGSNGGCGSKPSNPQNSALTMRINTPIGSFIPGYFEDCIIFSNNFQKKKKKFLHPFLN